MNWRIGIGPLTLRLTPWVLGLLGLGIGWLLKDGRSLGVAKLLNL